MFIWNTEIWLYHYPCTQNVRLTHFSLALIYAFLNIRKPLGFLKFLGAIDKQHRAVMD